LDSVTCFDDLSRKQKVEALYIMCHIILDEKHFVQKIASKPHLHHTFNITPFGYDCNGSVYWYFGTDRLYREDFENKHEPTYNSLMSHVSSFIYLFII